jgi:hypothetical protein
MIARASAADDDDDDNGAIVTIPESPTLATNERSVWRRELDEQRNAALMAAAAAHDEQQQRAFERRLAAANAPRPRLALPLTIPESPLLATRQRLDARRQFDQYVSLYAVWRPTRSLSISSRLVYLQRIRSVCTRGCHIGLQHTKAVDSSSFGASYATQEA